MSNTPLKIGAVLYPSFEMLDLFGPLEMFSILGPERVEIVTVAETAGPVGSALGSAGPLGPQVLATTSFAEAPDFDVLLIPGGLGSLTECGNAPMLAFLHRQCAQAELVACF